MKKSKNLGIWMDHTIAQLINPQSKENLQTIASKFTSDIRTDTLNRSESTMHNKEQQMDSAFFKEIGEEILEYDRVLLFGPTNAKVELHNYLEKDLHFKDIKFDVLSADKMTINEKHAFVNKHFKNK